MNHDWEQTGWEYDDSFYRCRTCKLETNCRRGGPAETPAECATAGIAPCKVARENATCFD
jgi:hypothetical protein